MTASGVEIGSIYPARKDAIRARIDAATPGPWFVVGLPWNAGTPFVVAGHEDPHYGTFVADLENLAAEVMDDDARLARNEVADAEFIAHAREDVEALLNDVEFLEGEAKRAWTQVGRQADIKAKALRAIDAVVALHRGVEEDVVYADGHDECDTCQSGPGHRETVCSHCRGEFAEGDGMWTWVPWPCPTIKALTDVMDPPHLQAVSDVS